MAESRLLPCNFWSWPSTSSLLLDQKAILIYLWTSRFSTSAGGFELPVKLGAAELGLTEPVLLEALRQFQQLELIEFDQSTNEVFLIGWFRWHKFNTTPQIVNFISAKKKIQSSRILKLVVDSSITAGVPQNSKSIKNQRDKKQHQHQLQHQQNLDMPSARLASDEKLKKEMEDEEGQEAIKKGVELLNKRQEA